MWYMYDLWYEDEIFKDYYWYISIITEKDYKESVPRVY